MTSAPLSSLFYATEGHISDKWEQYLAVYESELSPWHGKQVDLLEIGVQNGGSMSVWAGYFDPTSSLVGLDIDERIASLAHGPNVEFFVADGTDAAQLSYALGERTFDIIVDDGSHFSSDITNSFRLLFPRLNPGGRYFVEDLHCSYWNGYGGGLERQGSAIEFLKKLVDVLHFDHLEDLNELKIDVEDELLLDLRKGLARVTFYDSIAVVERLPFTKLAPYRRVLAGDQGELLDPLDLISTDTRVSLLFAQPLARKLESGLLRQFRELRRAVAHAQDERQQLQDERQQLQDERQQLQDQLRQANEHSMRSMVASLATSAQRRLEDAETSLRLAMLEATTERAAEFGAAVVSLRNQLDAVERSFTYRLMQPLRRTAQWLRRDRSVPRAPKGPTIETDGVAAAPTQARTYEQWRELFGTPSTADRLMIENHLAANPLPRVVVLFRVDVRDVAQTEAALAALTHQLMPDWQAWISIAPTCRTRAVEAAIASRIRDDQRFHITDPTSDDVAPFDASVVVVTTSSSILSEHALYLFAEAAGRRVFMAYGDAEIVDETKGLVPIFKPMLSPLHQQLHNYIGNTVLIDNRGSTLTTALSDFVTGTADSPSVISQVIALALAAAPPAKVERIPFVVQRDLKPPVAGPDVTVLPGLDTLPRVTIIVPTRDRLELLEPCIASVLEATNYPRELFEIIVVDNGSTDVPTLEYLRRREGVGDFAVIRDAGDFNYPRLNNRAAQAATGEVLILLNNDTTVKDPNWLRALVAYACQPGVGAVGAKLLYPDQTVQHGGVVLGVGGVAAHVNHMVSPDAATYSKISDLTHEVGAVTAACLAIRASVYKEIGGLDESLQVAFNDTDMCCATLSLGYRNIYIGSPLMIHHESKSRGLDDTPERKDKFRDEALRCRSKHPALFRDDPYYNPNLSLNHPYDLGEPPRPVRPWLLERRRRDSRRCILMLSSTHEVGSDIAVVIDNHARYLQSLGHRVIVGGFHSINDFNYEGCEWVTLRDEKDAAQFSYQCGADVVIMHTPPFFGTARWLGSEQLKIAYDHGEPDPGFLPDADHRRAVLADKRFSMALADSRVAISDAVQAQSPLDDVVVIPAGNDHTEGWGPALETARETIRIKHGWTDKLVVLNVCRFQSSERVYKGVDALAALQQVTRMCVPDLAANTVFVLGVYVEANDVKDLEDGGLVVVTNSSEAEMTELFAAADAYVDLSLWAGHDAGVAQALAIGLPTLATDIPAHRGLGISLADDVVEQVNWLKQQAADIVAANQAERIQRRSAWGPSLDQLANLINYA